MIPEPGDSRSDLFRDYRYHIQRVRTAAGTDLPLLMQQHRLSWLSPVINAYRRAEENRQARAERERAVRPEEHPGRPEDWLPVADAAKTAAAHCRSGKNIREAHRAASHALWVIIRHSRQAERAYRAAKIQQPD